LSEHHRGFSAGDVEKLAAELRPDAIAIDSPCCCADDGLLSRAEERAIASEICSIRYTPDHETVMHGGPFYGWIREGLTLYSLLAKRLPQIPVAETFPTAAWTVWAGTRGGTSRAQWSSEALATLRLANVPARTNQDLRDAIAAALCALEIAAGTAQWFGRIAIPQRGALASKP